MSTAAGSGRSHDPVVQAHAAAARVRRGDDAAALGITPTLIDAMVESFYTRIRTDARLGPVFAARIGDWPPHLAQMKRFWSSVLLGSGDYTGRPMPKHVALPAIGRDDFIHWLALFEATLASLAPPETSAYIVERARMIANSLLNGIAIHRDGRLGLTASEVL